MSRYSDRALAARLRRVGERLVTMSTGGCSWRHDREPFEGGEDEGGRSWRHDREPFEGGEDEGGLRETCEGGNQDECSYCQSAEEAMQRVDDLIHQAGHALLENEGGPKNAIKTALKSLASASSEESEWGDDPTTKLAKAEIQEAFGESEYSAEDQRIVRSRLARLRRLNDLVTRGRGEGLSEEDLDPENRDRLGADIRRWRGR